MPTMQFAFRLDEDVGLRVKEISRRLGVSSTDVFRMFAYAFAEADGFPFPLRVNRYNREATPEPFDSEREVEEFGRVVVEDMMRRMDREERRHGTR